MNTETPAKSLPNLRHLAAALEIKNQGSISRATNQIHLSQSAITQALHKLEGSLGIELFTRKPNGLFITDAGEIFLKRVERALSWLKLIDHVLDKKANEKTRFLYRSFTTTQLRAFIAVVEHGNYTLAANRLHLTQPTVHRAVKELETVCKLKFFQRSPAGVEANWKARQAARYINLFFAELSQGQEEVNEYLGRVTGSLRIGSLPLARTQIVPKAVIKLLEKFPQAKVSIIDGPYDEQLHGLLNGQLDIIVGALREPPPSPDIVQQKLFDDSLHLVVRPEHPLAKRAAKSVKELSHMEWIAPREHTPSREAFTRIFANEGLQPPEHIVECSSMVAVRGLLLESNRVAILPARQVKFEVESGLLAISPHKLEGTSRKIGLALRKNWEPTQLQQHFLELISEL